MRKKVAAPQKSDAPDWLLTCGVVTRIAQSTLVNTLLKFSMTVMCSSEVPGGVSMIRMSRSIHATSVRNCRHRNNPINSRQSAVD